MESTALNNVKTVKIVGLFQVGLNAFCIEGFPESVGTMPGKLGLKGDMLQCEDDKGWICDDLCFNLTGSSTLETSL